MRLEGAGIRAVSGQFVYGLFNVLFLFVFCRSIVLTYQEHLGVTYIILNADPSPRMLIHNKCPIPLLLKETVKGNTAQTAPVSSHPIPLLSLV